MFQLLFRSPSFSSWFLSYSSQSLKNQIKLRKKKKKKEIERKNINASFGSFIPNLQTSRRFGRSVVFTSGVRRIQRFVRSDKSLFTFKIVGSWQKQLRIPHGCKAPGIGKKIQKSETKYTLPRGKKKKDELNKYISVCSSLRVYQQSLVEKTSF